ncbi:hypothetical protein LDDCCGHA_3260 [Methylobacterium oxalidis]|nr:hypothetical protein LDDCCGHA_3260 [Methylobacterium oxalidis]
MKPTAEVSPATEPSAVASISEVLTALTVTPPPDAVVAPAFVPPSMVLSEMEAVAPLSTLFETSTPPAAVPPSTSLASVALIEPVDSAATVTSPRASTAVLTIFASACPSTALRANRAPRPFESILPTFGFEPVVPPGTTFAASSFFQSEKSEKSRVVSPRFSGVALFSPMYW